MTVGTQILAPPVILILVSNISLLQKMEAEKTEKSQKMKKKKKAPILVIGGSQSQGLDLSEEQEKLHGHVGPRRQVQSVINYGAAPSLSLDLKQNFPGLCSAAGS
jgi:lysine/ornithine N-monooxygenase